MNFTRLILSVRKNIRRMPYQAMAASMIMFATFLVISLFTILGVGFQQIIHFYETKPQAIAFFKDGTTDQDVQAIQNALNQTGKVSNIKFVSKNEAFDIYKDRNKENPTLLELVTPNILPASLEISTINPHDLSGVAEIIKQEPVVEDVIIPTDVIDTLTNAARILRVVGVGAGSFLLIFAMLSILMIVGFKVRVQRSEIETMKLLGASKWFIRLPYILEGMFYGVVGATLAWCLSYFILWYASPMIQQALGDLKILPISPILMLIIWVVEIAVAILVGGIGSYAAVRRYLKL